MLNLLIGLSSAVNWRNQKRLDLRINKKVSKNIYEKDKELAESEQNVKLDRLEFHLRLLCEKQSIHYQSE